MNEVPRLLVLGGASRGYELTDGNSVNLNYRDIQTQERTSTNYATFACNLVCLPAYIWEHLPHDLPMVERLLFLPL